MGKAFEEWAGPVPEIATDLDDWCEYQGKKKGWRNSLEWVLEKAKRLDWTQLKDDIEKELEEA